MSSRQITTRTIFIIWPCMQYGIFVFLLSFYWSIFGINLPKGCALQCFRFGLAEKQTPRSTLLKKSWNQMTCFEISENINRQNTHIWKNTMHRGANYLTREEKKSHASRPKHSVMLDRHMKNKVCFRLKKNSVRKRENKTIVSMISTKISSNSIQRYTLRFTYLSSDKKIHFGIINQNIRSHKRRL